MIKERFRQFRSRVLVDTLMRRFDSLSASVVKCFLLPLNRFCLLFGVCVHITLVLVFCVRCQCALCASLLGLTSGGPSARPAPTASDTKRFRPQTRSHFPPSMSSQRSLSQTTGFQQPKERRMPPTAKSLSCTERSMQPLTSTERSMRSLIGMERSKQSLKKAERHMQPRANASSGIPSSFGAERNTTSAPADVLVMFQPPYAVQDVVDEELKCAMLTIIDEICGHDLFHRRCAALQHYREEQSAVLVAPPKRAEKPIWGPQQSSSQCTYPWMLPNEMSELDKQLDNRMRNLWSAPSSFSRSVLETSGAEARGTVRGGSLPALPHFMCQYSHDMQAAVPRVVQSISAVDTVHLNVSPTDIPASIQLDISVQPFASCHSVRWTDEAAASQAVQTDLELASIRPDTFVQPTASCYSRPHVEETVDSQELAVQTELELTVVAQVDSSLADGTSSMVSETAHTSSVAVADFVQLHETVVVSEDAQSILAPENAQSIIPPEDAPQKKRILLKQKQVEALLEQQEMQRQHLQMMREKRAIKKKKRKKKKRQQQLKLQHL